MNINKLVKFVPFLYVPVTLISFLPGISDAIRVSSMALSIVFGAIYGVFTIREMF